MKWYPNSPVETLAQRQARFGSTTGFDYLRIALAVSVVLWHSQIVCFGLGNLTHLSSLPLLLQNAILIGGKLILPMFFALSGYLVGGSLERTRSIVRFLSLRALRIYPALMVEVLLSALLLGPLLTTLAWRDYFTSHQFVSYLWNLIGAVRFLLPGVFETNPFAHIVNMSMWTIPSELYCYLLLGAAAVLGVTRRRWLFVTLVVLTAMTAFVIHQSAPADLGPSKIGSVLALILSFFSGVGLFFYRDRIPHAWPVALLAVVLVGVFVDPDAPLPLAMIPVVTYITAYLGLLHPKKHTFLLRGDYSYGLYLFAFPIQQAYVQWFPEHRTWLLTSVVALCVCLAYAMFSWHLIEKPIMKRRERIIGAFLQLLALPAAALARLKRAYRRAGAA